MTPWLKSERFWLLIILALALLLRLRYLGFLIPYLEFQDERMVVETALNILKTHDPNPHFFKYGSFPIYLTSLIYLGYFFVTWLFRGEGSLGSLIDSFGIFDQDMILYLIGRSTSLAFGLGTIFLIYLIGKRRFGSAVGLGSAFLAAILPYHIFFSQVFKVDISLLFWVLCSVYFSCRLLESGKLRDYLLAGAAAGLALSTKYNFLALVPILSASLIYHRGVRGIFNLKFFLSVYAAGMVFLATTPYALLDLPAFLRFIGFLMGIEEQYVTAFHLDPSRFLGGACFFQFFYLLPAFLGPGLFLAAAGGLLIDGRRDWRRGAFFLAFPACYFFFACGVTELSIPGYIFPVSPFAIIWGALLLGRFFARPEKPVRVIGALLLAGILAFAGSNLFLPHFGSYYRVIDRAAAWADGNIPPGKSVMTYWGHNSTGKFRFQESNLQRAEDFSEADLERERPDYVILADSGFFADPRFRAVYGGYETMARKLKEGRIAGYRLEKVFSPPRIWKVFSSRIYREMDFAILVFKKP